ncbi:MAG: TIGR00341 family protein [Halanaeroarchaeum sp.]
MRLVQVTVPTGKREAILTALDDEGVDYVVTEETSSRGIAAVVYFPLPTEAVESVLDALRDAGLSDDAYTVVLDAQTVVSRRFEKLKEQYETEADSNARIAREELKATASDLAPRLRTFVILSVVSAVVATAGLLLNSPAIVVGSMVIAPLIGPAMETSVGSVTSDRDLFLNGLKLQFLGFGLAIGAAAVFAAMARALYLVPPGLDVLAIEQIRGRLSPDFLSLAVALGAGVAGALSLSTGVSSALVGVMIAAALIPPTAVIGIGIAWGLPRAVLGSSVLVMVNVLSINLAALLVLTYEGYRPESWLRVEAAREATYRRIAVLVLAIAVLSLFLGATTVSTYQAATFERQADAVVADALGSAPYADLEYLGIDVEYDDRIPFKEPTKVVVRVGLPPAVDRPPDLAGALATAIEERTNRSVVVEVHYVEIQRTG